jgi:exopolyphosphatase/guanosine-5'-triphosphate,3'-diphosphate pyrophosphatase
VVATSPFRQAADGKDLAEELRRTHRVPVTILSPRQEAMLAYLGNTTLAEIGGRRTAVVDLGGGSAEIAVGEGTRCIHAVSLPVGAVRMRQLVAFRRAFGRAEAALREALEEPLREVRALAPQALVFASGTARAARQLCMRGANEPGKTGALSVSDLRRGLGTYLGCSTEALHALGVEPGRADTVLVAATVMSILADMAGVHDCRVSDRGLRDGVALEVYRRGARASGRWPRPVA